MRLDSFTVAYSLAEDRLLLQAIGEGETQSFWITRRAALMIAEGIQKALKEQHLKYGKHTVKQEHLSDLIAFEHNIAAKKNPPKSGSIQGAINTPPLLLYQISYAAESTNNCVINLTDSNGQGHGYRLKSDMLHALLNLIQTQCDLAGWGLKLLTLAPAEFSPDVLQ